MPWVLGDPYLSALRAEIDQDEEVHGVEDCIDNCEALHEPPQGPTLDGQE